ncbi:PREDICTED: uncharacterized protein LOC106819896, partial [Priapulus caudatus]|uniref:Uncharacterized protein LOC106819896 n=1 Tax=Priapulus caudatus TaxID=37621 RepID=A0ABM1F685_PRICU
MNSLGLSLSLLCLVACVYAVDKPYEIGARPTEEPRPPEDYLPMPRMLNDVVDIKVNCDVEANTMTVNIAFERPFEGALFAKGNYKVEQCRVTATPGSKETVLVLPLDGCGVALDQAGEGYDARTFYNSTVIVMAEFAWGILEMGDRAYDVSCRFGGTQIDTLEFNMQVPNISPNTVTSSPITFSSCNMKIVQGRNPLVTSVNVLDLGDIATLVFWVDNQGVFDLSVFDCYAHDGMQMSRLELVDEAG